MVLKQPSWWFFPNIDKRPESELAVMRAEASTIDAQNVAIIEDAMKGWLVLKSFVDDNMTGIDKRKNRKILDKLQDLRPRCTIKFVEWIDNRVNYIEASKKKEIEERLTKEKNETAAKEKKALLLRAISFCTARGCTISATGEMISAAGDSLGADAISIANDIAFKENCAALTSSGGFVTFSGDDNCENCSGWDGLSRRCECGNRRVGWTFEGNFEEMSVYAEAW